MWPFKKKVKPLNNSILLASLRKFIAVVSPPPTTSCYESRRQCVGVYANHTRNNLCQNGI